jgi:hypothetical protein
MVPGLSAIKTGPESEATLDEIFELVTYCGLHCDLCGARARVPELAASLLHAMDDEGWPHWGHTLPGFTEFWEFLDRLQTGPGCPGCRHGAGFPGCPIRSCARERNLPFCARCPEFPCKQIETLAARYPTLIADNGRLVAVGLDQWLEEQQERVRRGVIYADTRHPLDDE